MRYLEMMGIGSHNRYGQFRLRWPGVLVGPPFERLVFLSFGNSPDEDVDGLDLERQLKLLF